MTTGHGHEWEKNRMQELRNQRGNKCDSCGSSENLEFHHILPTGLSGMGRGFYQRMKDISLHPDSYLLLCKSCHDDAHKKVHDK